MSFSSIESARIWAFERIAGSEASADFTLQELLAEADDLARWVSCGCAAGESPEHLVLLDRFDALDLLLKKMGRKVREHASLSATILTGVNDMSVKTDALAREIAEVRQSAAEVAAKLKTHEEASAAKDAQIAEMAGRMQALTAELAEAQGDADRVGTLTVELDTIQQGLAALAAPAPVEETPVVEETAPVVDTAPVVEETAPVVDEAAPVVEEVIDGEPVVAEEVAPVTEEASSEPVAEVVPVEEQAPAVTDGGVVVEQPATDTAAPQQ